MGTIPLQPNKVFTSREEVEALTYEEAVGVIRDARNLLISELTSDIDHEHWGDDCGDYMDAAITNYHWLWDAYFLNDGGEADVVRLVKQFLLKDPTQDFVLDPDNTPDWGGCDGEVRFTITPFHEEGE